MLASMAEEKLTAFAQRHSDRKKRRGVMNTNKLKEAKALLDRVFRELRALQSRYTSPMYVPGGWNGSRMLPI